MECSKDSTCFAWYSVFISGVSGLVPVGLPQLWLLNEDFTPGSTGLV